MYKKMAQAQDIIVYQEDQQHYEIRKNLTLKIGLDVPTIEKQHKNSTRIPNIGSHNNDKDPYRRR
jgi:hypothetical protein